MTCLCSFSYCTCCLYEDRLWYPATNVSQCTCGLEQMACRYRSKYVSKLQY